MFCIHGVAGVHLFREVDAGHSGSLKAGPLSLFQVIRLDDWSDRCGAALAGAPMAKRSSSQWLGAEVVTQPPPVSMGSSGRLAHSAQPPSYQLTRR